MASFDGFLLNMALPFIRLLVNNCAAIPNKFSVTVQHVICQDETNLIAHNENRGQFQYGRFAPKVFY